MHLDRSFLRLLFTASLWGVVYAQSGTDGRCGTCPEECIGRRYWWRTMWGFIVTLVVLTLDAWRILKSEGESTSLQSVFKSLFSSTLNPILIVWLMLEQALKGMAIRNNLCKALGDEMVAPLWPWSKSCIKIIAGTNVYVNLSSNVYEEVHYYNAFEDGVMERDLSEALVIGIEVKDSNQYNVNLSNRGELALLRANVLPPYDQLKFLRGSTNLGMTIAGAQAIGYIYGVVVRCGQGLRVSPIEAITCVLNIVVLMKVILHNFVSVGQRALLLYLLPEQEAKFIEECKNAMSYQFDIDRRYKVGVSIKSIILLIVGAYFIFNFVNSLNRPCVASIIIFDVSLVLSGILGFIHKYIEDGHNQPIRYVVVVLVFTIVLLNIVGYVWALIVTFKYWKVEEFDVQSSNYLSQVLPYIG